MIKNEFVASSNSYNVKKITDEYLDIEYIPDFITPDEASKLFNSLELEVPWTRTKTGKIYNKRICKIYGCPGLLYKILLHDSHGKYKEYIREAIPWNTTLENIKSKISEYTKEKYNFCAIQRYPTGNAEIKPHRDKEMVGQNICGLSLGTTRILRMSRYNKKIDIELPPGSLYIIKQPTNDYWLHSIPMDYKCNECRISLTFRNVQQ